MASHFTPSLFAFLRDLSVNNDRVWFSENKERYVESVQEPALKFIVDFAPRLNAISPHFRADARVNGGSLFRIHRDTRFSADKTPYKTNTGVYFRHERSSDVHVPGFYLHLAPSESFAGVGIWRPAAPIATRIRTAINEQPESWAEAISLLKGSLTLDRTETLKRVPREFEQDHSHADDLRLKSFTAGRRLTQKQVTSSSFIDEYEEMCRGGTPLMRFLCNAVGVEF